MPCYFPFFYSYFGEVGPAALNNYLEIFETDQACASPVLGYRKNYGNRSDLLFSRNSLFGCKSGQSSIRYARKHDNEPDDENVPLGLDGEEDEKTLDATEHKGSEQCSKERYPAAS